MSLEKCEADNTTNTPIACTPTPVFEIVDVKSDFLELIPETQIGEVGEESIDYHSLEDELTPGTLAILASLETFDEYFHCCGRW